MKQIFIMLTAVLLAATGVSAEEATPEVEAVSTNVYKQLKPFVLKDISGKEMKYAETFKGKMLLLFFFASWAQPCADQVPALVELQKKHGGKDFTVAGITLDERAGREVRLFAQKNKVNFPILQADMLIVEDVGGVSAVPTLCLVDQNRMLVMKEVAVMDLETLEDVIKTVREHQK